MDSNKKQAAVAAASGAAVGAGTSVALGGIGLSAAGTAVGVGLLSMTGVGLVVGLAGFGLYKALKK